MFHPDNGLVRLCEPSHTDLDKVMLPYGARDSQMDWTVAKSGHAGCIDSNCQPYKQTRGNWNKAAVFPDLRKTICERSDTPVFWTRNREDGSDRRVRPWLPLIHQSENH
jgi:hypothetical protein